MSDGGVMDINTLSIELYELSSGYEDICREYGDSKQIYERFEELKKTKLAQIKEKIWKDSPNTTAAMLEMLGTSSQEYYKFLEELSYCRKSFYQIQSKKEAMKNKIDSIITLVSLEKELLKLR